MFAENFVNEQITETESYVSDVMFPVTKLAKIIVTISYRM